MDWEITIAVNSGKGRLLSSILGKWHIGAEDGRLPTDHGFDEWYGPLRTYDECMWLATTRIMSPERDGYSHMHEGRKGKADSRSRIEQLTIETKKTCDFEYLKRSADFMERAVKEDKPFYSTSTTR